MSNRRTERSHNRQEPVDETTLIEGRHAVSEALRSGRTIDKLYLLYGSSDSALTELRLRARAQGVAVNECDRQRLDAMSVTGVHQGVIAVAAAHEYAQLQDVLGAAQLAGESPLIVVCDGINDPHNLGAIIRTAGAVGAHGVVIPKHRSVGLTATVAKAAADLTGPVVIVIGSEGSGMSRLVREACDFVMSIPMRGKIASLNASNAAAVVLFEAVRQRAARK